MKVSDYVMQLLKKHVNDLFMLSGGGIMHLVDSLRKSGINAYCCHHEQTAAIAAEGYSRINNHLGVALATSGPGGTNMITGAAGAWLDSIPTLYITGQVKTDNITPRKHGALTVRAIGFQELNIIDIVKPITKYAVMIERPEDIRYVLEKAIYMAKSGRPGPSWVDIPLDIQADEIDPEKQTPYIPERSSMFDGWKIPMDTIIKKLGKAKRPLLMVGNGIRLSGGIEVLLALVEKMKINVVSSIFTADDIVTREYPFYLGRQGVPGNKAANYAVDNCDLLIVIGERLQLTQTSYTYQNFATQATIIMVDIDENELHKKTINIDIPVHCDAKFFLEKLHQRILEENISLNRWDVAHEKIDPTKYEPNGKYLNLYRFLEELSKYSHKDLNVTTADGTASLGPHQALEIVRGQRFITNAGLGHMGSGLPLAIGACVANDKKPTICMEGDGSIMLNIQDLQTILHHRLPIKIFLYNNNGYLSIRNTHKNYFGVVFAADQESGVSFPNFEKLMPGWDFPYVKIANDTELFKVKEVLEKDGPVLCELMLDPNQPMIEKWEAGKYRHQHQT